MGSPYHRPDGKPTRAPPPSPVRNATHSGKVSRKTSLGRDNGTTGRALSGNSWHLAPQRPWLQECGPAVLLGEAPASRASRLPTCPLGVAVEKQHQHLPAAWPGQPVLPSSSSGVPCALG